MNFLRPRIISRSPSNIRADFALWSRGRSRRSIGHALPPPSNPRDTISKRITEDYSPSAWDVLSLFHLDFLSTLPRHARQTLCAQILRKQDSRAFLGGVWVELYDTGTGWKNGADTILSIGAAHVPKWPPSANSYDRLTTKPSIVAVPACQVCSVPTLRPSVSLTRHPTT